VSFRLIAVSLAGALFLAACSTPRPVPFQREEFQSGSTYSRAFPSGEAGTCEAARRALLSQGYAVGAATAELVNARKSFQPEAESHVEIEIRVVCASDRKAAPEATGNGSSLAFVSALQDRYALKKSNNSASVGVGAFGSLSLPFTSSDDAMVKVASETITSPAFYDRFFKLMANYLATDTHTP